MSTTPRRGRRTAIALGAGAAIAVIVLAWLGAPFVVDEWWIRKLRSSDEAEVHTAIDKIIERKIMRAAPVLLSIIGSSQDPMVDPDLQRYPEERFHPLPWLAADGLRKLDLPPEWFSQHIECAAEAEARAAIYWAGFMRWEETVPALRRVVEKDGSLAPLAALALARILPVIRVEGERPGGRSIRSIRLRFTNPTGRPLWFMGAGPERPIVHGRRKGTSVGLPEFKSICDFQRKKLTEFPSDSSFVYEEDVSASQLPLRFYIVLSNSASSVPSNFNGAVIGSWNLAAVESDVLESEKP